MGAAESKHIQQEAQVGSSLPHTVASRKTFARLTPASPGEETSANGPGLKRVLENSLSPEQSAKKRKVSDDLAIANEPLHRVDSPSAGWSASFLILNREDRSETLAASTAPSTTTRAESDEPSCQVANGQQEVQEYLQNASSEIDTNASKQTWTQGSLPSLRNPPSGQDDDSQTHRNGQEAIAIVPDLDSQLAGVSKEFREALVSLSGPTEEPMQGWKDAVTDSIPEHQRESNRQLVRRAIGSLRGVQHSPSFTPASLQQSTAAVGDCIIPGHVRSSSEEVETSFLDPAERSSHPVEQGDGNMIRSGKRRRVSEGDDRRKYKRRRRSAGDVQYPVMPVARLRRSVGLWRKDGPWTVLRGALQ